MSKQDVKNPRNFEQFKKQFDFAGILGLKKNVEIQKKTLYKVENELNNMLNSFIINLDGVIGSQSDVSLWFYDYIPTTSNVPYSNWISPADHDGDLFYNKSTGRAYQYVYSSNSWVEKTDESLILALATTNSGIDTTIDHERKIYFTEPSPPYDAGDWWIQDDGILYICQLSVVSGSYRKSDWTNSANYVATVAARNNNEITVLKGTVTEITESYVKITDLATGGSTSINGSNIVTGSINADLITSGRMSANRISGGTIDANLVTIANNNVQMDKDGIKLHNGAKVIGTNGLKNTYLFENEGFAGFDLSYTTGTLKFVKKNLFVDLVIPNNFVIEKANVKLIHNPVYWHWQNIDNNQDGYNWGNLRGVKLYKCTNVSSKLLAADYNGQIYTDSDVSTYSEISGAFGSSGFTSNTPTNNSHNAQTVTSSDIKNSLTVGLNRLKLETSEAIPTAYNVACQKSAYLTVQVEIEGYMSYT